MFVFSITQLFHSGYFGYSVKYTPSPNVWHSQAITQLISETLEECISVQSGDACQQASLL